eukprot:4370879-Alexandrium_andersonii.AAC.1
MSASLVGSEMCIRDRDLAGRAVARGLPAQVLVELAGAAGAGVRVAPLPPGPCTCSVKSALVPAHSL